MTRSSSSTSSTRSSTSSSTQPAPHSSSTQTEPTTRQALDLFLTREVATRNYSPTTRRTYVHDLQEFLRSLPDDMPTDQLALAQVKQYLATLDRRGLSSATKHRKLAAVKTFIRFLEEDEPPLLATPFSVKIPLPTVERREPRYLSKVEYQAVLREASDHPRDAPCSRSFSRPVFA
jgi:site-specific recombinase XerD